MFLYMFLKWSEQTTGPDGKLGKYLTMTVADTYDDSGEVEYMFECADQDVHNDLVGSSYWQEERKYEKFIPLDINVILRSKLAKPWAVKARDKEGHETHFSWPVSPWGSLAYDVDEEAERRKNMQYRDDWWLYKGPRESPRWEGYDEAPPPCTQ